MYGPPMRTEIAKQDEPRDGAEPDVNRERQKKRSKRFGIEVVEGAALTFPSGFPRKLSDYGDPVNLKFPTESKKRAANARVRFKQFANETYKKTKSKKVVHNRIVEAELRHGITPSIDLDDPLDRLLSSSLRRRVAEAQKKSAQKGASLAWPKDLAADLADHIEDSSPPTGPIRQTFGTIL